MRDISKELLSELDQATVTQDGGPGSGRKPNQFGASQPKSNLFGNNKKFNPKTADLGKYTKPPEDYSAKKFFSPPKKYEPKNQEPPSRDKWNTFPKKSYEVKDGGPGSGNFAHGGRPGFVGGSSVVVGNAEKDIEVDGEKAKLKAKITVQVDDDENDKKRLKKKLTKTLKNLGEETFNNIDDLEFAPNEGDLTDEGTLNNLRLSTEEREKIAQVLDLITATLDDRAISLGDKINLGKEMKNLNLGLEAKEAEAHASKDFSFLVIKIDLGNKVAIIHYDDKVRSQIWNNDKSMKKLDGIVRIVSKDNVHDSKPQMSSTPKDIVSQLLEGIGNETMMDGGPGSGRKLGSKNKNGTGANYVGKNGGQKMHFTPDEKEGIGIRYSIRHNDDDISTNAIKHDLSQKEQEHEAARRRTEPSFSDLVSHKTRDIETEKNNARLARRLNTGLDKKPKFVGDGNIALQALSKLGKFISKSDDGCGDAQICGIGNVASLICDTFDVDTVGDGGPGSGRKKGSKNKHSKYKYDELPQEGHKFSRTQQHAMNEAKANYEKLDAAYKNASNAERQKMLDSLLKAGYKPFSLEEDFYKRNTSLKRKAEKKPYQWKSVEALQEKAAKVKAAREAERKRIEEYRYYHGDDEDYGEQYDDQEDED